MHSRWRDVKEWGREGLKLSTSSDEAAKQFDASLTQYVGFYDDATMGGLASTLHQSIESDPCFVMARVILYGLQLIGSSRIPRLDPVFQKSVLDMSSLARAQLAEGRITAREAAHADAIGLLAAGQTKRACDVWQGILIDHPTDMLAIKFLHDRYLFMGDCRMRMLDNIARIRPLWSDTIPLYGYLHGIHAFALVETERFDEAERVARAGLAINARDSWSTHSIAHVLDMTGRPDEGSEFLSTTSGDWRSSNALACHLNWHDALYHVERGAHADALEIFDDEVDAATKRHRSAFNLSDACSLLYRLQLEGVEVGQRRWSDVYELCRTHRDDHTLPFNDIHMGMAYACGAPDDETRRGFIESLREYMADEARSDHRFLPVALAACESMDAYSRADYTAAATTLLPFEWQLSGLGGSTVQRDVITQFLIHSLVRSARPQHRAEGRRMLIERKAKRNGSALIERLIAMSLSNHDE